MAGFRPLLPLLLRHRQQTLAFSSSSSSAGAVAVAVFWDLDSKPPAPIPPYDAAVRLRLAAASLGPLRLLAAFAGPGAFRRQSRPRPNSPTPHLCRVCGRQFFAHAKLVHHFEQIHETEQAKRLRRLESARGGRRVRLAASLSLKMKKYEKAARELVAPEAENSLADELRRAGVLVRSVDDNPEAAMVGTMDKGRIGCLVLVSDDPGLAGMLREARMRCLKTVVIGNEGDGVLKRCADATFSWKDVVSGKARKEVGKSVGRWKDKELLKKLEWTYDGSESEAEGLERDVFEGECEDGDGGENGCLGLVGKKGFKPWWKVDSDSKDFNVGSSR